MITRREIRGLAEFQSARGCAVTFYYQPGAPPNQSHREEAILVKDLVRGALREAEKEGRNDYARADLNRILELAERLHGNAGKAKAVFADSSENFWREFDIPAWLDKTRVMINRRFHLRPLAPLLEVNPRASRTVPYVSKATGVPLPKIAVALMLGRAREGAATMPDTSPGVFPNSPSSTTKRWRIRF